MKFLLQNKIKTTERKKYGQGKQLHLSIITATTNTYFLATSQISFFLMNGCYLF